MSETPSPTLMGSGEFTYEVHEWAKLPEDFAFGDIGGVAVDSKDQVYVFNRSRFPMMVFDREGNLLRTWGHDVFNTAHGIHIDADDHIWCTDTGDHTVRKFTPEGKLLLTVGAPGDPAPAMSGRPFNRCTHSALSPEGDLYVTDGYGNARVHKFSPDGKHLFSWGGPGIDPGEFNLAHNIWCDGDGWVYVADRENHRVQVFNRDGKFETEWHHLHRPCALCASRNANPLFYVAELPPGGRSSQMYPNLGARVTVVTPQGKIIARVGADRPGTSLGQFVAPHGVAVDSHGDIYVSEVAQGAWSQMMQDPKPEYVRTFRKLVKRPA
ncbi:MAG: peptidyl-alpha-hydroxyglycine alpha-amidating lyase family protein [Pseudomonadota bacterium]